MREKHSLSLAAVASLALVCLTGCGIGNPSAIVKVNRDISSFNIRTVAILPFEGVFAGITSHGDWTATSQANNGEVVSDMLATELMGVGGFHYIERSQMRKILEEQGLAFSDLVQKKTASEIGKLMGADAVILGAVSNLCSWYNWTGQTGSVVSFSVRMVHAETGVILWSATVTRREGTPDMLAVVAFLLQPPGSR